MKGPNDPHRRTAEEAGAASASVRPSGVAEGVRAKPAPTEAQKVLPSPVDRSAAPDQHEVAATASPPGITAKPSEAEPVPRPWRKWLLLAGVVIGLAFGAYFFVPWLETALNTISTDDAYINGHVTLVAARVAGHVSKVLVDDNYRVKKGDVLVELDPEPYRVQVAIKKAAVDVAQKDLAAAQSQVRGLEAQARSQRWKLQHAMEDVDNQIALLAANVATLESQRAVLARAQADFRRAQELLPHKAIAQADYDQDREALLVAEAQVKQALQNIYQTRASLGLPAEPPGGQNLASVPPDLDQTFSSVRQAQADLIQAAAQLGVIHSFLVTPRQMVENFQKQAPGGDIDRLFDELASKAPAVGQAEAKLQQAQRDLDQAELNLRYCTVVTDIDGVETGRNVNPGDNVLVGQSLMAVRSVTEIWIDANFKETQLADLRIGQPVRCEVDMYRNRRDFEGRITGFTMGTGETLALLPPQNATGNYVKIVQRLPVRIELTNYNPDKTPLFVGLSVTPYVYYKKPATGPHAGDVLQPLASLPAGPVEPKP
jgi:membrane fusion protein (multidrug efflux system)